MEKRMVLKDFTKYLAGPEIICIRKMSKCFGYTATRARKQTENWETLYRNPTNH